MTKLVLGILCGLGLVFIWSAITEANERKKIAEYEKLMERMRKLP